MDAGRAAVVAAAAAGNRAGKKIRKGIAGTADVPVFRFGAKRGWNVAGLLKSGPRSRKVVAAAQPPSPESDTARSREKPNPRAAGRWPSAPCPPEVGCAAGKRSRPLRGHHRNRAPHEAGRNPIRVPPADCRQPCVPRKGSAQAESVAAAQPPSPESGAARSRQKPNPCAVGRWPSAPCPPEAVRAAGKRRGRSAAITGIGRRTKPPETQSACCRPMAVSPASRFPETRATGGCGWDAAICVAPWPRSGGSAPA